MNLCGITGTSSTVDNIKMVEIDFQTLCRICGKADDRLTSVHSPPEHELRGRIAKYLQVEITEDDCLPTKVCGCCKDVLAKWHELYEKCQEVECKFKTIINSSEELYMDTIEAGLQAEDEEDADDEEPVKEEDDEEPIKEQDDNDGEGEEPDEEEEAEEHLKEQQDSSQRGDEPWRSIFSPGSSKTAGSIADDDSSLEHEPEARESRQWKSRAIDRNFTIHTEREPLQKNLVVQAQIEVDGKVCYQCGTCRKVMSSPYVYQAHLRIHSGERPYVCPICQQQFRVVQGMRRHIRSTHNKERNYPCDICGRRFGNSKNLKEHRYIHTAERPHKCEQCEKTFTQRAALFMHRKTHGSEFQFRCAFCAAGFHSLHKLQRHESIHSPMRPYKCDVCNRGFRSNHNRNRHKLVHAVREPLLCAICNLSFKQKRHLKFHLLSRHSIVEVLVTDQ